MLFAHDLPSPSGYLMVTHTHPVAGKLPIKILVASQLQTNTHTHTHSYTWRTHTSTCTHIILYRLHVLTYIDLYTDELPTLKELIILKYTEKGERKKLSILNEAYNGWKDIAGLICDDPNKMSILEQDLRGNPKDCLLLVLIEDFIDKKPQTYSQDWSGLIELLDDVGLKTLAENVKHATSSSSQSLTGGGTYMYMYMHVPLAGIPPEQNPNRVRNGIN